MKPRSLIALFAGIAVLLIAAGCGHARLWGGKASGSPAHLGGDISIPLDKR